MSLLEKVSLQFCTFNDLWSEDFRRAVRLAAACGYTGIEFLPPEEQLSLGEMRQVIDECGLTVAALHIMPDMLLPNVGHFLEAAKLFGTDTLVIPTSDSSTMEKVKKTAVQINQIVDECRQAGIHICYHNHAHEFVYDGDTLVYDALMAAFDPYIEAELDVYWCSNAGFDPVEVMKKQEGRLGLIHLKDMRDRESKDIVEVGSGCIDIPACIAEGKRQKVRGFVVEQDQTYGHPVESAMRSRDYLMADSVPSRA